jgi:AAT family amino acid transporter
LAGGSVSSFSPDSSASSPGSTEYRSPPEDLPFSDPPQYSGVAVTWLLAYGLGRFYPDFAADRSDGLGYFAGALFVLFGFGTWVMSVLNWKHWPWPQLGLRQPLSGLCELAFVALPTIALYLLLGLPSFSSSPTNGVMSGDTVLGWFYSIVVVVILTGQLLDNWPWRIVGGDQHPGRVALAATIGNAVAGTLLYFVMIPVVKILIGSTAVAELGGAISQFPAQLGVCWVFWMIFWANAFGNRPTKYGDAANFVVRAVVTFILGVATFIGYYFFAAQHILHEPVVAAGLHGNALGCLDWVILWTLLYVVGFQSYGLNKLSPDVDE